MKTYIIPGPERLKDAVAIMKWQKEADRTAAFARVWLIEARRQKGAGADMAAVMEIGKEARLYKIVGGIKTQLGTAVLKAAKEFAKTLTEVEA